MRLIDGDELLARYKARCEGCKETKNYCEHCRDIADILNDIEDAPTIEERKKGKWSIEETNTYELSYGVTAYAPVYKCSACGRSIESHLMLDEPIVPEDANFSRFCPWCGADMREEKDNETN